MQWVWRHFLTSLPSSFFPSSTGALKANILQQIERKPAAWQSWEEQGAQSSFKAFHSKLIVYHLVASWRIVCKGVSVHCMEPWNNFSPTQHLKLPRFYFQFFPWLKTHQVAYLQLKQLASGGNTDSPEAYIWFPITTAAPAGERNHLLLGIWTATVI